MVFCHMQRSAGLETADRRQQRAANRIPDHGDQGNRHHQHYWLLRQDGDADQRGKTGQKAGGCDTALRKVRTADMP